jgi:LysR family transcriptional regulator, nitrogen assimilation regulatory protein
MQLQQLRYFLAVLDQGGFTRAAQHLGRTQQAVSKAMRQLESELGVRLLDRESGIPGPTAFGRELAAFARRVLHEESQLRSRLQAARSTTTGTVRIGASPTVAGSLVAPAVDALGTVKPGLVLQVHAGIQSTLLAQLEAGELDVAVYVRTDEARVPPSGLASETLRLEEYLAVAASTHPLAHAPGPLQTATLAAAEWVLGANSGDVEAAWREVFEAADLAQPEPRVVTTSVEFCRTVLARGRHVSVLPRGLVAAALARGELAALDAPQFAWQRPIVMSYPGNNPLPAPVLAVIQALHDAAASG